MQEHVICSRDQGYEKPFI